MGLVQAHAESQGNVTLLCVASVKTLRGLPRQGRQDPADACEGYSMAGLESMVWNMFGGPKSFATLGQQISNTAKISQKSTC